MRTAVLLLGLLLLSCGEPKEVLLARAQSNARSWLGDSEKRVLGTRGTPDQSYDASGGCLVLMYKSEWVSHDEGKQMLWRQDLYIAGGKVVAVRWEEYQMGCLLGRGMEEETNRVALTTEEGR